MSGQHSDFARDGARLGPTGSDEQQGHHDAPPRHLNPRRDEEFWYEDGSIILRTRDMDFRVYQGILATHSPVFKDMLSLPQPSSSLPEDPRSQGNMVPVVHLTDSPEDLRKLLRICMPSNDSTPFEPHNPDYHTLSACIRLGHKYQISKLVEHSIKYLKQFYPSDFDKWTAHGRKRTESEYGLHGLTDRHCIDVVQLAHLTQELELLPTALMACCLLQDDIVNGFEREDGTREYLSAADLGRCFKAARKLAEARTTVALRALTPGLSKICNSPVCRASFDEVLRNLDKHARELVFPEPCSEFAIILCNGPWLCSRCVLAITQREEAERRDVWNRLPSFFDLEVKGWGEAQDAVRVQVV
ncbi:hypothetical protein C8T65DRAFT_790601 [Cerioporus squamosus]|nr:hypothetical protein C8T65DRAFT_790601 [Cerioporus squamosus]